MEYFKKLWYKFLKNRGETNDRHRQIGSGKGYFPD